MAAPNATYRCHEADWAHFIESDDAEPGAVRKLSPLEPQLELFDNDFGRLMAGKEQRSWLVA